MKIDQLLFVNVCLRHQPGQAECPFVAITQNSWCSNASGLGMYSPIDRNSAAGRRTLRVHILL